MRRLDRLPRIFITQWLRRLTALLLTVGALCACGDGGPGEGPPPVSDASQVPPDAGAVAALPEIGSVSLIETTWLGGRREAAIVVRFSYESAAMHVPGETKGACTLWVHACDPQCDPWMQRCVDGACVDDPSSGEHPSAGVVTVTGLTHGDVTLTPGQFGYAMKSKPTELFEPGAPLHASAPGDEKPGFDLTVGGVADMDLLSGEGAELVTPDEPESNPYPRLTRGVDAVLRWSPGGERVRLELRGENRCHGCPPAGAIRCETADMGAVVVDGSLLAALPENVGPGGGCAGGDCLESWIERVAEAHVAVGDGRITLRAVSRVAFYMDLVEAAP